MLLIRIEYLPWMLPGFPPEVIACRTVMLIAPVTFRNNILSWQVIFCKFSGLIPIRI